jgi:hypothetical protein
MMRHDNDISLIKEYINFLIDGIKLREVKLKEVDITSGKAIFGSKEHIDDLNSRINSLVIWRDKSKRGSANRENYSRLISKLKSELKSAIRKNEKENLRKNHQISTKKPND